MSQLMPEFLPQFVRLIGKGWQDVLTPLVWPQWRKTYLPQPQCGRCHQDGTGQATPDVIGSKRRYSLKGCKPNNADISRHISTLRNRFGGNLHKVLI